MKEPEILQTALDAQSAGGPSSLVTVLLERVPEGRNTKNMRLRPYQGPRGVIIAITPAGTQVQFEAHKIIKYLGCANLDKTPPRPYSTNTDRTQFKLRVDRMKAERVAELAALHKMTINAFMEGALDHYIQNFA